MKSTVFLLFVALFFATPAADAAAKKHYILYGTLLQDTIVDLADGARWAMDKGDSFPVVMFKEQQTKVMLQLAGTTFLADAPRVRILKENEITPEVLAAYRRNVQMYINNRSEQWKALQTR